MGRRRRLPRRVPRGRLALDGFLGRFRVRHDACARPPCFSFDPHLAPARAVGSVREVRGRRRRPLDLHAVAVRFGRPEHRPDAVDVHAVVPERDLRPGRQRPEVQLLQRARRVVSRAVPRQPPGAQGAERAEDYREADEAEDHDGRRRVEVAALAGVDDAVPAASTSAYLGLHIRHERQRARQRERTAAPHP